MSSKKHPIHSISIAEFDIDKGNTLTVRYPDFKLKKYDYEYLANLSIPDGAHIHHEDWTYILLDISDDDAFKKEDQKILYGLGLFRCVHDETVRRGAIQRSILILSWLPYFSLYLPLLRACLNQYFPSPNKKYIQALYNSLNENLLKENQIKLWGETFPLNIPVLHYDEMAGASLVELIKIFKIDTMILWYALLLQKRILFVGNSANSVGNCVLAAPLLVSPIYGYKEVLAPYISLIDTTAVMKPHFIAGTTNIIFEEKESWSDFLGSFQSTSIIQHEFNIKITGDDRRHIQNVISGINDNKGEAWVRQQFREYTDSFLYSVLVENQKGSHKKYLPNFIDSDLFKKYFAEVGHKEDTDNIKRPSELINNLENSFDQLPPLEKTKLIYNLHENLVNLTAIDEACNADGVRIVSEKLKEKSPQIRKYSTAIIAQMALCVKGQIAILSGPTFETILSLLNDTMSNVKNAACYCLMKISSLYIGAVYLVQHNVHSTISQMIFGTTDLKLKSSAVRMLVNIYSFLPNTLRLNTQEFQKEFDSKDPIYISNLMLLFDLWEQNIPNEEELISSKIKEQIEGLKSESMETRVLSTTYLLSELSANPNLVLELILANGIEILSKNERQNKSEDKISALSFAVLGLAADFYHGRTQIISQNLIERAINGLKNESDPVYLFHVSRFLEILSQHKETLQIIEQNNGLSIGINFVVKYVDQAMLNNLCFPIFGMIQSIILENSKKNIDVIPDVLALETLFIHPKKRFVSQPSHDHQIQEMIATLLRLSGFDMDSVMEKALKKESFQQQLTKYQPVAQKKTHFTKYPDSLLIGYTESELLPMMSDERKKEIEDFIQLMQTPFTGETGLENSQEIQLDQNEDLQEKDNQSNN
ncbi:arf3-interacting protein [Anaeramoeba ignava]|uniref:Arf3-interacting protein n=1 Tax=Anaeramoeba ignava TaxID=1746090 RepID=A0A9Q0LA55_ANAIG|nr:arf3-interacting protein [Anaeramoeba ignava]|eukprot:Anaeramoba_ignava/a479326_1429.p1 GENE.a479326_1429~~a479326_1429.p1  ORF type:complete len:877 (-),score=238.51 a479326_1429:244-2874(-)